MQIKRIDWAGDGGSPRVSHVITLLGEASEMPALRLCWHRCRSETWTHMGVLRLRDPTVGSETLVLGDEGSSQPPWPSGNPVGLSSLETRENVS